MFIRSKALLALLVGAAVFAALSYASSEDARSSASDRSYCCAIGSAHASETLDPALFNGEVREAYDQARHNPALLAQLHCYCGCDKINGHRNLLDCFRDTHGSRCEICVGEALEAKSLAEQGTPVAQIRDALRRRFAPEF